MGLLVEGPETAVLALCHDMAECVIGDITPHCKVNYHSLVHQFFPLNSISVLNLESALTGVLPGPIFAWVGRRGGRDEYFKTKYSKHRSPDLSISEKVGKAQGFYSITVKFKEFKEIKTF